MERARDTGADAIGSERGRGSRRFRVERRVSRGVTKDGPWRGTNE